MKLFRKAKDGGPESHVTGYWLIEWKSVFSIALLRFEDGSRENYHSHAFDAISWLLRGELREEHIDGRQERHAPSLRPILTTCETTHRVFSIGRSWALTFRGPWKKTWIEYDPRTAKVIPLTHGRVVQKQEV